MNSMLEAGRFGSGQAVQRIEDAALLSGRGQFTDDVPAADAGYVAFQRSPHAHARIVSIDSGEAAAMPGVIAVLTGAELVQAGIKPIPTAVNFKRPDGRSTVSPPRRALAHEFVRYVGEPVVAVVATSREAARDAAEAVFVEYEDLPSVSDVIAATAPGAVVVCAEAPDNVAAEMRHGDAAAVERAFAGAAHAVALDLVNQRLAPSALEPRSVLATWEEASGRLTVRLSNQMPTSILNSISDLIPGFTKDNVRVVVGDVGGGFGMKTGI
ncbi:MAG: hypothetical protein ABT05_04695 [Lautropia sp. SCN 66-9]|nr:MAG: hypothetical protein ABT05_04695 [Lautropia sp. SCN 66-9]